MNKDWVQWIIPTDAGQLRSALGPSDKSLVLWDSQGDKVLSFGIRGPVLDIPEIGRPMVLGWQAGIEVAPQLRIAPPAENGPWGILFQLEVVSSEGERTHMPRVGMSPLETVDLVWDMSQIICDVLKELEFSVGSLSPDGRPGGMTILIQELTGSANYLFERLLLFRAALETIASARGFQVQSIQLQTDSRGIFPIDGQLLGMDF